MHYGLHRNFHLPRHEKFFRNISNNDWSSGCSCLCCPLLTTHLLEWAVVLHICSNNSHKISLRLKSVFKDYLIMYTIFLASQEYRLLLWVVHPLNEIVSQKKMIIVHHIRSPDFALYLCIQIIVIPCVNEIWTNVTPPTTILLYDGIITEGNYFIGNNFVSCHERVIPYLSLSLISRWFIQSIYK